MSKFLDRLEQISRGAQVALGFGATRPAKVPGMALVGLVTSDYSKGVSAVAKLAPDAALIAAGKGKESVSDLTKSLDSKLPWGVQAPSMTPDDIRA